MSNVPIPEGLKEILLGFTIEVIRNHPRNICDFALQYFAELKNNESKVKGQKVKFNNEAMQIGSEDEDEEFVAPVINRFARRVSVCAESYDPDKEEESREPMVIHFKTDEQRQRLLEACKYIVLFKSLEQDEFFRVLDAMFERPVAAGEHIIEQHEDGDNFYVIQSGIYDVHVTDNGITRLVGTYDNHGSFGELALMYNTPRATTIIARTSGALWCLDRQTFRRIIVKNNAKKRKMYDDFIQTVPLLSSLETYERMKVVDVLVPRQYTDGQQIIAEGESADDFYIVESGQVRITIRRPTQQEGEMYEVEIATCTRGQYFGELALVTNKPRAASAYAVGNVKCLVMDVMAFERLLGPCMEIMKRNISNYEAHFASLLESNDSVTNTSSDTTRAVEPGSEN
ncbi:cAMP-dependent protein kinase type II-alpha regulatory subunit-like [Alosa sapidissima]|uniref:cAMP-dependent protein kinase type II-alpha regulatory subunit-like n=1 Tax=Alosa sapidissima TaxID=34773 RepID=UPI001C0A0984|nr:cAMP-dependent protein kinase type II-alpha regulatory subunit-like [Alosa sapidissima]XP_041935241.1 cAMP-dependent protein kinase type II-alpha regulatory subunit-like [Alosa sapidissima]